MRVSFLLLASVCSFAREAPATPPSEQARAHHEAAMELAGRCKTHPGEATCGPAIALWQEACELDPRWQYLRNLAIALLHAGRHDEAWRTALRAEDRGRVEGLAAEAGEFLANVEGRLRARYFRLELVVEPHDAVVSVAGRRVETRGTSWHAPGAVEVTVALAGFAPQVRRLSASAGETHRLAIRLEAVEESDPPAGPVSIVLPLETPPPVPKWATWTVVGAGIATSAAAIVLGGLAAADRGPTVTCPATGACPELDDARNGYEMKRDAAIGLSVTGASLLVTGVVLSFFDDPEAPADVAPADGEGDE